MAFQGAVIEEFTQIRNMDKKKYYPSQLANFCFIYSRKSNHIFKVIVFNKLNYTIYSDIKTS